MKKHFIIAAMGITALTFFSCEKVLNAVFQPFTTDIPFEVTLPALPASDQQADLGSEEVYFNLDSTIKEYTKGAFNINSIENLKAEVQELTISLDGSNEHAPDSANNLANFETIRVALRSDSNPTPIIYETSNPDVYATSVSLPIDQTIDLVSYLKGTRLVYVISGRLRRSTTRELSSTMNTKIRISN